MTGPLGADARDRIAEAADALWRWARTQDFRGWDPHDALRSPLLRTSSHLHRWAGVAAIQTVKRSPLNLRPLLRVPKSHNPKGMGLLLVAASGRWKRTGDAQARADAVRFGDWLVRHAETGYAGPAWGYDFDWANRGFFAPAGTPTVVNTSVIGLALRDAAASGVLEDASAADRVAGGATRFITRDLHRYEPTPDEVAFSYTPLDRRYVHNASTWAAWLLAAYATADSEAERLARAAARFVTRRQEADGSWRYGPGPADGFTDNFHTGFVLDGLRGAGRLLGTEEFEPAVRRGYEFWRARFFDPDGAPRYYVGSRWPIDAHAVAQAVLTHLRICPERELGVARAGAMLLWGIDHMWDSRGYFHYQLRRTHTVRTPFMRWVQAWMLHAMETWLLCAEGTDAALRRMTLHRPGWLG